MGEEEGINGYRMLNNMLSRQNTGDEELLDLMQEYAEKRAIVKLLMKPDDGGRGINDRR